MLSKQQILDLLTEEKNQYATYLLCCAQYKIEPDSVAQAKALSKIETLECLLKLM